MNTFDAIEIIEGLIEADEYEILDAWQYLIDTGVVWQLQGYYGRTAHRLIDEGLCSIPGADVEVLA